MKTRNLNTANPMTYFCTRIVTTLAAVVLSFGFAAAAAAQTAFPMICSSYPAGIQRGKTTMVTVASGGQGGNNLYGAYKVVFEGDGIKAEVVPPEKGWPARNAKTPFAVPGVPTITLKVTAAADAALGVREFRVATPVHGVSTIGLLVIGDEPEINETEPNNDLAHAQAVTVPTVINGAIQASEDIDVYKFRANAGQEIVFSVLCARLEDKIHDLSEHCDPLLVLRDSTGREIARNDDYYRADPLLHYKFDKAGDYLIEIRDVGYKGNPFWVYRLSMTSRPYVVSTVPCAVQPGRMNEIKVVGFNLGGVVTAKVDVPADARPGVWRTPLSIGGAYTNVTPLLVSAAPQSAPPPGSAAPPTAASIPSTSTASASTASRGSTAGARAVTAVAVTAAPAATTGTRAALAIPGGVNAVLTADEQIDRYTFHAKGGAGYAFETTARRLDSEIDTEIKIRDAKGNVLAENDDGDQIGKDSHLDWSAPADGDYTIEVRDLTGHSGPTYFYNLTAVPYRQDFRLKVDTDRAAIAPGNRTAWFVMIDRKYGFAGDVKIDVSGLPAGVTASALTIPPEMTQGVVILTCAPGAKIDMAEAKVTGTATLTGADGKPASATREATPLTEIYLPGGGRGLYPVDSDAVAITEPNDIEVSVANSEISINPGETLKIDVTIKRRADYTKPVTLDLRVNHLGSVFTNPLPPGITVDDGATIPENQSKGVITLKAAGDAHPIKNWPLAVMANVSVNFVMKTWYVAPLSLTVNPAPKK